MYAFVKSLEVFLLLLFFQLHKTITFFNSILLDSRCSSLVLFNLSLSYERISAGSQTAQVRVFTGPFFSSACLVLRCMHMVMLFSFHRWIQTASYHRRWSEHVLGLG